MKINKGIYKIFYNSRISKIYLFIILVLLAHKPKNIRLNNSGDYLFKKYFCQILLSRYDPECEEQLFINHNYFFEINGISRTISLLINIYSSKIENLLMLIGIIPLIKENSIIHFKINNKQIYYILLYIFKDKKIENNIINFTHDDFDSVKELINIINYNWEIIPSQNIINIVRHVIFENYEDSCLKKFDEALNSNFNYYINNNLDTFSYEEIENLMSKFEFFIFNIKNNRKYFYL